MHVVESYATNLGLKIDKPEIYESYYPIGDFDYITLSLGGHGENVFYKHWQDVINIAFPLLEKNNIKIVQCNSKLHQKFDNCINLNEYLDPSKLSYVIRKSKLHLSENGLDLDLASANNVNMIYLDPSNDGKNDSPYWGEDNEFIYLNESEDVSDINRIKPEKICKYIFDFLNLKFDIGFETVFIGENYPSKNIQFIPDQNSDLGVPEEATIIVRMDKYFNEENLARQLQKYKCVIVTNKPINLQLLHSLKQNVHHIAYFIEKNDNPEFVQSIQQMGVSYILLSYLSEDEIQTKKINYMDNDNINITKIPKQEEIEQLKDLDINSLYYLSNGPVLSNFKVYKSVCDYENRNNVENPSLPIKIKENLDFWKEINNFHIVKKVVDTN